MGGAPGTLREGSKHSGDGCGGCNVGNDVFMKSVINSIVSPDAPLKMMTCTVSTSISAPECIQGSFENDEYNLSTDKL